MKMIFLSCLAALAILPCHAVQKADNYETAKNLVQDNGYILFAYAEDWDTYSKRTCEKLMSSEVVAAAAGNAVFIPVPIPNLMTEERKKADKEKYGPLQVADAPDYPAILMLDKNGRHYSTITGPFMHSKITAKCAAEVADMISQRLLGQKRQADLLEQAKGAKGVAKAKLIGEAAKIPNVNPVEKVGQIIRQIKNLDPKDESGYARKLRDPMDFVGEIVGIEKGKNADQGWQPALKKVEEYLSDPVYSKEQQQALHALAIGLLHRHGGPRVASDIRKHAKIMRELDPNSYIGKSADLAEREWAVGFNLIDGWNPSVIGSDEPIELQAPLPIRGAGAYEVTFNYERGNHACSIAAVSLYDGDKLVVEDRHAGSAGHSNKDNVYKLQVGAPLKEPHLFIEFKQGGSNNSFGHITITRR